MLKKNMNFRIIVVLALSLQLLFADYKLHQIFKMLQEQSQLILPVKLENGEIYALEVNGNTLTLKLHLSQDSIRNPCNTPLVQDVVKHNGIVQYVINDKKIIECKK